MAGIAFFDARPIFSAADFSGRLHDLIEDQGVRVQRPGAIPGSLDPDHAGLDYIVVNGSGCKTAPWLWDKVDAVRVAASAAIGVELERRPDEDALVNVNVLDPGKGYEKHVDQNSHTAVIFTQTLRDGALSLNGYDVRPSYALGVVFEAGRIPHWVKPASARRVTLVFGFCAPGTTAEPINKQLYEG